MFGLIWDMMWIAIPAAGGWWANNKIGPGKVESDRRAIASGKKALY